MIKMIAVVWKKPGLTDEQFEDLWFNGHGTLARRCSARMGFVKYVQSHKLPSKLMDDFSKDRGWSEPPDGVAEVWWESEESMMAALGTPEGQEASRMLKEDEERFIHPPKVISFLTTEEVIYDHTNGVTG